MKIAFAVDNLGASQLNHDLILAINRHVNETADDVVVFFEDISRPCLPLMVASMHIIHGWSFDGPVVATSLRTAESVLRFARTTRRALYAYDLEWIRQPEPKYRVLHEIYGNPQLELLARCEDHAQVLRSAWNRSVTTVAGEVADFIKALQ